MRHTKSIILLVILFFGVTTVLNGILIFFERQSEGATIVDYPTAFWYLIVTLSTVGYGDHSPVSLGGQIIGYVYVIASLGVIGFLFSTISKSVYTMLEESKLGFKGTDFEQHIIFLGWNDFDKQVADEIVDAGKKIAILTENKDQVDLIYDHYGKDRSFVLFSDHQHIDTYKRLNVKSSAVVFIAMTDDSAALMEVVNLRSKFPNICIVVSLNEAQLKQTFISAGVTYVVARNEIASKLVASYIFEPDVARMNTQLISSKGIATDYDVQEYEVLSDNTYIDMNGPDLFHRLKDDLDVVLMGISKSQGNGQWEVISNPSAEVTLKAGDYLILMTNGHGKERLRNEFKVNEGRIMTQTKV